MIRTASQFEADEAQGLLPNRMRHRLEALGVCCAVVTPDGVTPLLAPGRLERLVLTSAPFAAAVREQLPTLPHAVGSVQRMWPGLWLATLPDARRRRLANSAGARARPTDPLVVAVLFGHDLLQSDQLRLVCAAQQVDLSAIVRRNDSATLLSDPEAIRLAAALGWMHQDSVEIDRRLQELQTLSKQLGDSYEELSLLYKLSTSMSVNQAPTQFLTSASMELCEVVGLRWMALQLIDNEPLLNDLAGQVFTAGEIDCDPSLLKRIGHQLLDRYHGDEPHIIDDTQTLNIPHLPRLAHDLLVITLHREDKTFGILFGGDKLDGHHISSVDSKLCNSLASSLAIFLENRMLYEDMHAIFLGTLHALTSSIDAKDSYTHGHSERVALLSRMLAEATGLEPEIIDRVYISALVHDVGKIGVPEAVLCKPGRLTSEEFELIKKHPEIGARILQDIRQMQDLIPGVLYHHERWDGKGYPHKLQAMDIPLFGRLICLADSFDAMSSSRTYRTPLKLEQVLEEIARCAGSQFDPDLAQVFIKMDFAPFFTMLQEHNRQMDLEAQS